MPTTTIETPIGPITVTVRNGAVAEIAFAAARNAALSGTAAEDAEVLDGAAAQLRDYFAGRRHRFTVPIALEGTPFQRRVWTAMTEIPYGRLRSYAALARQLSTAPRAVGGACGRNPIPIIVPCHRVVSETGIGGYSGGAGLVTKRRLLKLEGVPAEAMDGRPALP